MCNLDKMSVCVCVWEREKELLFGCVLTLLTLAARILFPAAMHTAPLPPLPGLPVTRVPTAQDGNVWEKAGVNVSVVYGSMPAEAYRAATARVSNGTQQEITGRVPFFAAGISSVMHPKNPFAPTMHFNYR